MQPESTEDIRSKHERTGGAPGKVTLSTWPTRFFISFLIVSVFSFAGLIAYIVTTQQADPEVVKKMEQIKGEISDSRKEALKGAPGFEDEPETEDRGPKTEDREPENRGDAASRPAVENEKDKPDQLEQLDKPDKLDR